MKRSLFIYISLCLIIFSIIPLSMYFTDIKEWRSVEKHSEDFVYNHTSIDGHFHILTIYDSDSTVICEAFLDSNSKTCCIFDDKNSIFASSYNKFKSKSLYKKLIEKVPEEYRLDWKQIKKIKVDKILEKLNKLK